MCTFQAQAAPVRVLGYSTKAQTPLGLRFIPSLVGAAQGIRSLTRALSLGAVGLIASVVPASVSRHAGQVCLVFLLGI